ncbi:MAG TPA: hypothetical protein DEP84_12385 [Chloroflexi bacterium]|nr:hypothetical protein [Chloroflexota bacterium]
MQPFGKLVLTRPAEQEQEFALAKASVALGRAAINDIVLNDSKVSRAHARIECGATGCVLVDLDSANGTRVNGVVLERAVLTPGDIVTLGDSTLRFETAAPRVAPDVTLLHSEADLEATLAQESLEVALSDTRSPRLAVHVPGKTWEVPLTDEVLTLGRQEGNDITLDHPKVSRRHARIERRGDLFIFRDLGSTNGTWLGGQRVEERVLQDGDTIRIGSAQLVFKRGFDFEDLTLVEAPLAFRAGVRRPVVIVPGFMGSELWAGSERVWPHVRHFFTHPEIFRLPDDQPLEVRQLVGEVVIVPNLLKLEQYNRLGNYLEEGLGYERGKDLLEFAYDWRQDVRLSARRLAEVIDSWPVTPPITLIAHSMGCLVSRYYVERLGGKKKVGRLILLGGPHGGVPKMITTLLLGPDLLPFGLLGDRLREVLASFPCTYQILPTYTCTVDQEGRQINVLTEDLWLAEAQRPFLHAAREFRRELGTRSSVPCVSIFGYGVKTVTGVSVQRDTHGRWHKVDLAVESGGDNIIPETSAVMPGSEIHPVQQYHGTLYVDNDVKMRLKLELTR